MKTMIRMAVAMVAVALLGVSNAAMAQSTRGGRAVTQKVQPVAPVKKEVKVAHKAAPSKHVKYEPVKKVVAPKPAPVKHHACVGTAQLIAPSAHSHAVGTVVEFLPSGAVLVNRGGVKVYVACGAHYKPIVVGGRRMYKVVALG